MTFYEVLEIDPDASTAEIERVFRQLARKVHPDLNSGDPRGEARMKLLNEIRDTLTDPLRRATYDAELANEAAARAGADGPATPPEAEDRTEPLGRIPWSRFVWVALGVGTITTAVFVARAPDRDGPPSNAGIAPLVVPPVPPPPQRATALPPEPAPAASPSARGPGRARGIGRTVIKIGTRADDVIHKLGPPDRVEPGAHSGDAVLHYGRLRLEIKNGRVARGDAAE